jgi:hypothetical protein
MALTPQRLRPADVMQQAGAVHQLPRARPEPMPGAEAIENVQRQARHVVGMDRLLVIAITEARIFIQKFVHNFPVAAGLRRA